MRLRSWSVLVVVVALALPSASARAAGDEPPPLLEDLSRDDDPADPAEPAPRGLDEDPSDVGPEAPSDDPAAPAPDGPAPEDEVDPEEEPRDLGTVGVVGSSMAACAVVGVPALALGTVGVVAVPVGAFLAFAAACGGQGDPTLGVALLVGGLASAALGAFGVGPCASIAALVGAAFGAVDGDRALWPPLLGGLAGPVLGLAGNVLIVAGVLLLPSGGIGVPLLATGLVATALAAPVAISGIGCGDALFGGPRAGARPREAPPPEPGSVPRSRPLQARAHVVEAMAF